MRLSWLVSVLVLASVGGCDGGRCERPPCDDVDRGCDRDFGCFPEERCEYADDGCGVRDTTGVCEARPEACSRELDPVCGCDGQVHANPCMAALAGTDLDAMGTCQLPLGSFACGARVCARGELCVKTVVALGMITSDRCEPLAPPCDTDASCACLEQSGRCEIVACSGTAATGLSLFCRPPEMP